MFHIIMPQIFLTDQLVSRHRHNICFRGCITKQEKFCRFFCRRIICFFQKTPDQIYSANSATQTGIDHLDVRMLQFSGRAEHNHLHIVIMNPFQNFIVGGTVSCTLDHKNRRVHRHIVLDLVDLLVHVIIAEGHKNPVSAGFQLFFQFLSNRRDKTVIRRCHRQTG